MTRHSLVLKIVGDRTACFPPHDSLDASGFHAADFLDLPVAVMWVPTASLETGDASQTLSQADALWIAPGSPYRSMEGALRAIRYARESRVPLLGTCGGCQHVVIEFARNVLGITDAAHAEYDPYASRLIVMPLSCSLVGREMNVDLAHGSHAASSYQAESTREQYYCNFGINPEWEAALDSGGLRIVGRDAEGESRIFELSDHPFFIATLFVPNLRSTAAQPHPLIRAWVRAAAQRAASRHTPLQVRHAR